MTQVGVGKRIERLMAKGELLVRFVVLCIIDMLCILVIPLSL